MKHKVVEIGTFFNWGPWGENQGKVDGTCIAFNSAEIWGQGCRKREAEAIRRRQKAAAVRCITVDSGNSKLGFVTNFVY